MRRMLLIIGLLSLPVLAQEVIYEDGFENNDPVIVSSPVTTGSVGVLYNYDVDAIDIDKDELLYLLTTQPAGMTIDPVSGLIQWTPGSSGNFDVAVDVSDGVGGLAQQLWSIKVSEGVDTDGDGLGDLIEEDIGTDPDDPDTDDDGLEDGAEVLVHHSDPLRRDTDRDGLEDGDEVDVHATDPAKVDTDGDHFGDGMELDAGTDPLNAADYPAGPPDPQSIAPPNDPTVTTNLFDSIEFMLNGTPPIQINVGEDAIDPVRVAVLRGRLLTRDGDSLQGVSVSIKDQADLGQTESRIDGRFDFVVNGGGLLTVNFSKPGYLPVQRTVSANWRQYAMLPDVVMIPLDAQSTVVDLTLGTAQLAQSSSSSDADGTRHAALIVPAGTAAELQLEGGGTQPIDALTLRASEYTVGANGPEAMPGVLPPYSGYTYAVELSADEAFAEGVAGVTFNQPVYSYTENFLEFPVGTAIPAGYYDRNRAHWVSSRNGRVIKILGETGGLADVDIDGDEIADSGSALSDLGFTDAERQNLAITYAAGQELWRVPVEHFTPWDYNWPYGPPADAVPPLQKPPWREQDVTELGVSTCRGSMIDVQDQVVRESVPIAGTPFRLNYSSADVPDRRTGYTLNIALSDSTIPASLQRIELDIAVAGQSHRQSFEAAPEQLTQFTWDGTDAYGRGVIGRQHVNTNVSYVYDAVYYEPDEFEQSFGRFGNQLVAADIARQEIRLSQPNSTSVGNFDARSFGLGGWRLDIHHAYDPVAGVLVSGNGLTRGSPTLSIGTVGTVAGDPSTEEGGFSGDGGPAVPALLDSPRDLAVLADGSILIADTQNDRIRKVSPDGVITTIAGTGDSDSTGDGGPALSAGLDTPASIAVGPDGSIYVAEFYNRIRRIGPDGIIDTFAGGGAGADGGPAVGAQMEYPRGLSVASDGTLYFADTGSARIRRIGTDGIIDTIAGDGTFTYSGDGGLARDATFQNPMDIAIAPDGSLFIASEQRVRRIATDGTISTVAGNGVDDYSGDGGLAPNASFLFARTVAFSDDALYIGDDYAGVVRRVDAQGVITTYAGDFPKTDPNVDSYGDGGPPLAAGFYSVWNLAVDSGGGLYIADRGASDIRRVGPVFPGYSAGDIGIASEDGSEYYQFNANGKHLSTRHALTGAVLFEFGYDGEGRLQTVTDGDGKVTTIERNLAGEPTAIVGPFGQVTTLSVDINGFLEVIENPAGEQLQIDSTPGGLIAETIDPRGRISSYGYDSMGRLISQSDNAGYSQSLVRTGGGNDFSVARTTGLGRTTGYQVLRFQEQVQENTNTAPDGSQSMSQFQVASGVNSATSATGMATTISQGADPRFGRQAPIAQSAEVSAPGGPTMVITSTSDAELNNIFDPLSLITESGSATIDGRTTNSTFTAATKTLVLTSPVGRISTDEIDDLGRVVKSQFADLAPVQAEYNTLGQLTTLTHGTGETARETTFTYGSDGFRETMTGPLGRTVSFDYDAAGRLTTKTLPGEFDILFGYDDAGELDGITPPGQPEHKFEYTPTGQLSSITPPMVAGSGPTSFTYNDDRQITAITRPGDEKISFGYDAEGRLSTVELSEGGMTSASYTMSYVIANQVDTITGPGAQTVTYGYQGDLITSETWSGLVEGSVSWTYDNAFRVASEIVSGGATVNYGYDDDDRILSVGGFAIARNAVNGLALSASLGVVSDNWNHNAFGEVTDYSASANGSPVFDVSYTLDDLGRISQKVETIGGVADTYDYDYDSRGQLIEVQKNSVVVESYIYDDNGNRLSATVDSVMSSGSYDAQDRVVSYGDDTYDYSPAGRLLSRTEPGAMVTTYDYDPVGNLRAVTLPNATKVSYRLDGPDRRVQRSVDDVVTHRYLYEDNFLVAELSPSGDLVSQFVYAGGHVPSYMIRNGVDHRILTDRVGSVRLVVNATTGAIAQRLDYDSFGNVVNDTNPGFQPFGFAGGIYDSQTDLVHFGTRDYDPRTGRYTAKDLIGFGGEDSNLYRYVQNNPINRIDPTGLTWFDTAQGFLNAVNQGVLETLNPALAIQHGLEVLTDYLIGDWLDKNGFYRDPNPGRMFPPPPNADLADYMDGEFYGQCAVTLATLGLGAGELQAAKAATTAAQHLDDIKKAVDAARKVRQSGRVVNFKKLAEEVKIGRTPEILGKNAAKAEKLREKIGPIPSGKPAKVSNGHGYGKGKGRGG